MSTKDVEIGADTPIDESKSGSTAVQSFNAGNDTATVPKRNPKNRPRPCRYFNTPKGCKLGDACPFRHTKKRVDNVPEEKAPSSTTAPSEPATSVPVSAPSNGNVRPARIVPTKIIIRKEQKGEQAQLDAKKQDIQFFMKRFPKAVHMQNEDGDTIVFNYKITDPDWIFDVRTIKFGIKMETGHPVDVPVIMVPSENIALPEILKSHLEAGCNEALKTTYANFETKNAFEPVGKIFVRWLDRNMFELFVAGLKKTKLVQEAEAAGIRLVVPNPDGEQPQKEQEAPAITLTGDPDEAPSEAELANLSLTDKEPIQNDNVTQNHAQAVPQQSTPEIEVALVWRDTS
ncbi:unnamed protein product [Cylicocyclus nassatus]|uniref:C3H1-type domain-containing protein n=1 Tax=Cylicocyclus nassatus TaxID=53992 RepID=A0AA36MDH0_CYLNA|nr:unnamed protein product [Cylicocyclus nassatus]